MHTPWAKAHISDTCMPAHSLIVPKTCDGLSYKEERRKGETMPELKVATQSVSVCISVYSAKAEWVKMRYREKGESWQLCLELINLRVCLYQRGTALICTHTQPGSSLSFNSAVSLSFCFSLSLRSWEREKCPGWLRAGELMPHTFCFFLSGQSLNTNICKCGNEDLDLKSCALKMINSLKKNKTKLTFSSFRRHSDPNWCSGDIFKYAQVFEFHGGERVSSRTGILSQGLQHNKS